MKSVKHRNVVYKRKSQNIRLYKKKTQNKRKLRRSVGGFLGIRRKPSVAPDDPVAPVVAQQVFGLPLGKSYKPPGNDNDDNDKEKNFNTLLKPQNPYRPSKCIDAYNETIRVLTAENDKIDSERLKSENISFNNCLEFSNINKGPPTHTPELPSSALEENTEENEEYASIGKMVDDTSDKESVYDGVVANPSTYGVYDNPENKVNPYDTVANTSKGPDYEYIENGAETPPEQPVYAKPKKSVFKIEGATTTQSSTDTLDLLMPMRYDENGNIITESKAGGFRRRTRKRSHRRVLRNRRLRH